MRVYGVRCVRSGQWARKSRDWAYGDRLTSVWFSRAAAERRVERARGSVQELELVEFELIELTELALVRSFHE